MDDGDFKANDFSETEKDFPLYRQLHCQDCKREAVPCLLCISPVLNLAYLQPLGLKLSQALERFCKIKHRFSYLFALTFIA